MNSSRTTTFLAFCSLAGSLSDCLVYAPMQPTVSGIRAARQVEASAGIQANARLDASLVAAPLPHLLLAGAGCYRPRLGGSDTYFGTRQWEAAVGTYLPLGPQCVLSGLVGYGCADSERKSTELFGTTTLFSGTTADLRARYGKTYGQLNAHWGGAVGFGVVYRAVRLRFDELTFDQGLGRQYDVPLGSQWRHELLVYGGPGLRSADAAQWQWQTRACLGVSLPNFGWRNDGAPDDFYYRRMFFPALLAGVTVTLARQPR